jgi:hypothetical protein
MSAPTPQAPPRNDTGVPDPSLATIAILYREIETITATRDREIGALRDLISVRLDGMDRAADLKEREAKLVASNIQLSIAHQKELLLAMMAERAESIKNQFEERDVRTQRDAAQVKLAVDAALQAAKEAVQEQNKGFTLSIDKSDAAKTKEIDSLGVQLRAATGGLEGQIADLKDRMTRIESAGLGRIQQVSETRAQSGDMRSWVLMGVALLSIAIAIAGFMAGQ